MGPGTVRRPGPSRPLMKRAKRTPHRPWSGRGTRTAAASLVEDCDDAAQRRLTALETPREAAELDLLVQHVVDLPAQVFDVDDVVRKQKGMHDLVIGPGEDLVEALAELFLPYLRLVRANPPDDGVERMIRAACVDCDPADTALEHPLGKSACGPRVTDEVPGLVSL